MPLILAQGRAVVTTRASVTATGCGRALLAIARPTCRLQILAMGTAFAVPRQEVQKCANAMPGTKVPTALYCGRQRPTERKIAPAAAAEASVRGYLPVKRQRHTATSAGAYQVRGDTGLTVA
jgi:hypothetical protein